MTQNAQETRTDIRACSLLRFAAGHAHETQDLVAVEEPLEIQVAHNAGEVWMTHPIAVTMRTPGHDLELAAGFLHTEQVITERSWIQSLDHGRDDHGEPLCNRVCLRLRADVGFDLDQLSRHTFTSSSCGICGKQTIERIRARMSEPGPSFPLSAAQIYRLPLALAERQRTFQETGGLHASALFSADGDLICLREDVGRHNALDKLIGRLLLDDQLPARDRVLMLSGRASFELVQKAIIAGIPHIVALGAPSSLAVDLAREFAVTLVGFLKPDRFNVYSGTVL